MDLDVLFWLVIAGIAGVALSHLAPPSAVSTIWRYREVLWPSGVQEDDDARWTWARTAPRMAPDAAGIERPATGRVSYEVRSAADRARS